MNIYIDNDYKCHSTNDGGWRAFDVPFFDGKCDAFISGYRYVPTGEKWVNNRGIIFKGEMFSPWQPYEELLAMQKAYEEGQATGGSDALLAAAEAAYKEGVNAAYD